MLPRLALVLLLVPGFVQAAQPHAMAQPCAPGTSAGEVERVMLAGVDAVGDPLLTDGRVLRLVGIAPRQDEAEDARFRVGLEAWRGQILALVALGPADRWGRLPARLFAFGPPEGGMREEVNTALVASGAGRRMAEAAFPPCGGTVSSRSATALTRPDEPPRPAALPSDLLDSHDIAALMVQSGRFVALKGRIASVGERAQRTYLNLSRRRGEAASIVMSRRLWREMQQSGWTAARLSGRAVRAEGVLSGRDGLLLEITAVSALNVID